MQRLGSGTADVDWNWGLLEWHVVAGRDGYYVECTKVPRYQGWDMAVADMAGLGRPGRRWNLERRTGDVGM